MVDPDYLYLTRAKQETIMTNPPGVEPARDIDVAVDAVVAPLVSSRLDRHECVAVIEIPFAYRGGVVCW